MPPTSEDLASVSVVIPSFNRADVVGRAIRSALNQSLPPLEIIVVDDGSTDDTRRVVQAGVAGDARVRLMRLERNRGGAGARNAGIEAARGQLVAFLDSDDEWGASHLERRVRRLRESGAGLVFGSFRVDNGREQVDMHCAPLAGDPLEYLFLDRGGFRTSTFVCDAGKLRRIMFDETLLKHQDWDLVINFLEHYPVATDAQSTVTLHTGGADRLSAWPNHEATARFYRKNRGRCSRTGWVLFATIMLESTFRAEGRGADFARYLALIDELDPAARAPIARLTRLLDIPRVGRKLFRAACGRYCVATARRRQRLPALEASE